MANTQALRRRIRSVKSTQQITKAMKMVAAAKLRRAQGRIVEARPYADALEGVLRSLASRVPAHRHPLLDEREERRVTLVVITGDKGLCGAFNSNVLREASTLMRSGRWQQVDLVLIGRKATDFFKHRGVTPVAVYPELMANVSTEGTIAAARDMADRFSKRDTDSIYLLSNRFRSIMQQKVVLHRLLPVERARLSGGERLAGYIFEPTPAALLDHLLPRYVEFELLRAVLSSQAAEHAARMTAMGAATKNAGEMIDKLTLTYNRVRQASITKELIEIVSGAQALGES
ncbi:MAG: ATP synthase F1 subunit gamma [Acidobacteriota bacterium]